MFQFFVEPNQINIDTKTVVITGSDVNHIKNVLRMKMGEQVAVCNGVDGKEYHCAITGMDESSVVLNLLEVVEDGSELPAQVVIFQGLPKADKMELIIQKNVELGVHSIVPMATKRCVVKLDDKKAGAKITRWQGIAEAAAKQSKRGIIPQIGNVMTFKQALSYVQDFDIKLIPYEHAEDINKTREILQAAKSGQRIAVFIGPEGGFEEAEVQQALDMGVMPITLGKRILRTETAGFTIMSWLMYLLEI
ncbi:MAG: 16S rRNA (uracil(1498)-N(3))-methyltransferase [Lachnospiraceae bacterium]|nr:16S rRNA (uracil(1498)-N(3))-methyltransferase [Lachnospiraceae bacterium]